MQSAVLAIVNPSVRPSVCLAVRHPLALCQYDSRYDHIIVVFNAG